MSNTNKLIDQAFKSLSKRDQQIMQKWALQADPFKPNYAIRLTTLAVEFNLSKRQIERILMTIRKKHPELYIHLKETRTRSRDLRKITETPTPPQSPRQPLLKRALSALRRPRTSKPKTAKKP